MIYAENILVLLVAPFFVGLFFLKREMKRFVGFFLIGAIICLLSSYINSFIAGLYGMPSIDAIIKITPVIEEVMKSLPLLFCMIIFTPKKEIIFHSAIALSIGFATFENCCYIVNHGAEDIYFILIRGFSVGTMHLLCGAMMGFALAFSISKKVISWIAIYASITLCISYHAIYNLIVSGGDHWQLYGYFLPFATVILLLIIKHSLPLIRHPKTT